MLLLPLGSAHRRHLPFRALPWRASCPAFRGAGGRGPTAAPAPLRVPVADVEDWHRAARVDLSPAVDGALAARVVFNSAGASAATAPGRGEPRARLDAASGRHVAIEVTFRPAGDARARRRPGPRATCGRQHGSPPRAAHGAPRCTSAASRRRAPSCALVGVGDGGDDARAEALTSRRARAARRFGAQVYTAAPLVWSRVAAARADADMRARARRRDSRRRSRRAGSSPAETGTQAALRVRLRNRAARPVGAAGRPTRDRGLDAALPGHRGRARRCWPEASARYPLARTRPGLREPAPARGARQRRVGAGGARGRPHREPLEVTLWRPCSTRTSRLRLRSAPEGKHLPEWLAELRRIGSASRLFSAEAAVPRRRAAPRRSRLDPVPGVRRGRREAPGSSFPRGPRADAPRLDASGSASSRAARRKSCRPSTARRPCARRRRGPGQRAALRPLDHPRIAHLASGVRLPPGRTADDLQGRISAFSASITLARAAPLAHRGALEPLQTVHA